REIGGYGCLFSFTLKNPEQTSAPFYDALRVCKGPSLGTNFTLACPYTLLAHYDELEWVESCGVSRWLIRVSAGLEDTQELIARFDEALARV
ncbi:MAG TPA: PLP-dependent transferase, partial [Prosthecobacter sp.]